MEASSTTPATSTADGVTVADAVQVIGSLGSQAAVDVFTAGDERKGVRDAAEARKAELAASPTPSTAPPGVNPLSGEAPPEAAEGRPLAAAGQGTVKVRTRYPVSSFDPNDDDLPTITSAGVEIDRSQAEALIEAAATAGTTLEEVD